MTAFVGCAEVTVYCPGCFSLKDKRRVVKSLLDRLRSRLNVAAAEVDHQDQHRRAALAFATVSSSQKQTSRLLDQIEREISGDPSLQIRELNRRIL